MRCFPVVLVSSLLCVGVVAGCGEERETLPPALPLHEEDTLFVAVPGGTFVNSAGDTVFVESFSLQKYEVSNRLYRYLADRSGLAYPADPGFPDMDNYFFGFPDYPVVNVSPAKAESAASVVGARLPTRDEWEYAASLGLTGELAQQYPWGALSPEDVAGIPANYMALNDWQQRDVDGFAYTAPCGSYPLSEAGVADLAGNVAEEVTDDSDSTAALMGGSWAQVDEAMMIGFKRKIGYGDVVWYAGFRMAK